MHLTEIPLEQIRTDPNDNHRLELDPEATAALAEDIKRHGLLQPIRVTHDGKAYKIIFGNRRLAATRQLNRATITAVIEINANNRPEALRAAENLTQERLSPVEESIAITQWMNADKLTVDELAILTGRSRNWIQTRTDIAAYPHDLQQPLHAGELTMSTAAELALITDETPRTHMLRYILQTGANTQIVKTWVQQWHQDKLHEKYDPTQIPDPNRAYAPVIPMTTCFICRNQTRLAEASLLSFCPDCLQAIQKAQSHGSPEATAQRSPEPHRHTVHTALPTTIQPEPQPPA